MIVVLTKKTKLYQKVKTDPKGNVRINQTWWVPDNNQPRRYVNGVLTTPPGHEYRVMYEIPPQTDFGTENYWEDAKIFDTDGKMLLGKYTVFEISVRGRRARDSKIYYQITDEVGDVYKVECIDREGKCWKLL